MFLRRDFTILLIFACMNSLLSAPTKDQHEGPCPGDECPDPSDKQDSENPAVQETVDEEKLEALLHGGQHIDHNAPSKDSDVQGEPTVVNMEHILHGGEEVDHNAHRERVVSDNKREPSTADMEATLHGGEHVDHNAPVEFPERVKSEPSTADLDKILHGGEHVDHNAAVERNSVQGDFDVGARDMNLAMHGGELVDHNAPKEGVKIKGDFNLDTRDMHALMHDGQEVDHNAQKEDTVVRGDFNLGTKDMHALLHNGDDVDHNAVIKDPEVSGKPSTVDMESILHGGDHVNHNADPVRHKFQGSRKPSTLDMETILHGDKHVDHDAQKPALKMANQKKPSTTDMETILHGADHVHDVDLEDKNVKKGDKPLLFKQKGYRIGTMNPHALLHGEHATDSQGIDQGELKDYKEWQEQKNRESSNGQSGFSFPYITDTILNEIEILKRRYLPKFWRSTDVQEEIGNKIEPLDADYFDSNLDDAIRDVMNSEHSVTGDNKVADDDLKSNHGHLPRDSEDVKIREKPEM